MKAEVDIFLEKYASTLRKRTLRVMIASALIYAVIMGINIYILQGIFTDNPLYQWGMLALTVMIVGFQLIKNRKVYNTLQHLKETLEQPGNTLTRIELEKQGKKNSYEGITYSMKLSVNTLSSTFVLANFQQNEAFFNEAIQTFTKAYPKAEVKHFE